MPRQGPAGRRLLKRRLLINFPKRNKQTTVQSLNARLSQPWTARLEALGQLLNEVNNEVQDQRSQLDSKRAKSNQL